MAQARARAKARLSQPLTLGTIVEIVVAISLPGAEHAGQDSVAFSPRVVQPARRGAALGTLGQTIRIAMEGSATITASRARLAAVRATRSISLAAVLFVSLVIGWTSATAAPANACPGTAHRFETFSLLAPSLEGSKRILVYLPPGYDCATGRRYPAFYFNDGQDLFDWNPVAADLEPDVAAEIARREAWYGSWRLDAQLDRAIADRRLPPMIVVGIASDDGLRSRDLAPVPWRGSAEGRGAQYGDFVAETVVAATDHRFRTVAEPRCRGIGGASLGAISALQIGLAHPESFGLVLAFSPPLADPPLADHLAAAWSLADPAGRSAFLIDFDDGPIGSADLAWFTSMAGTATTNGGRQPALIQTPGGHHAIASWAERVVPALQQLFGAQCSD
jgi:enterochelin esterase-like enzyme